MLLCYVDESGDEQPLRTRTDPPVLVIGGLIVQHEQAKSLIWKFLQIKKKYNNSLSLDDAKLSDVVSLEMKGSDLRRDVRSSSRRPRRRAFGILDDVMALLEQHNVSLIGEVHVKGQRPLRRWVYSDAIAWMTEQFESALRAADAPGQMILDARTKAKNVPSVHRITTKRFKSGGDPFPRLVESPLFGHSDAHVVLQIADIVVSGLLFPMACAGFCSSLIDNVHINPDFSQVRTRYGARLRLLEHRYTTAGGGRAGGVRVTDHMNHQTGLNLYLEVPFEYRPGASTSNNATISVNVAESTK
ncbi:DUF3800 domain-containing protein [Microbacteriaceae bacterium VKM Ac-2854]|nr:DUF3800 domain-containing protein [Microbacteriaceae bacterium VKM Ac-2854]